MIYVSRKGFPTLDPKTLVDQTLLDALANDAFLQSLSVGSKQQ